MRGLGTRKVCVVQTLCSGGSGASYFSPLILQTRLLLTVARNGGPESVTTTLKATRLTVAELRIEPSRLVSASPPLATTLSWRMSPVSNGLIHCHYYSTKGLSKSMDINLRPEEKAKAGHTLSAQRRFSRRWVAAFRWTLSSGRPLGS